jgi:hypothetical protein
MTFSYEYTMPAGPHFVFSVTGQDSKLTAVDTVDTLTATLGVSYSGSPKPGDTISVTLTGAYTAAECKAYLDGRSIGDGDSYALSGLPTLCSAMCCHYSTTAVHIT